MKNIFVISMLMIICFSCEAQQKRKGYILERRTDTLIRSKKENKSIKQAILYDAKILNIDVGIGEIPLAVMLKQGYLATINKSNPLSYVKKVRCKYFDFRNFTLRDDTISKFVDYFEVYNNIYGEIIGVDSFSKDWEEEESQGQKFNPLMNFKYKFVDFPNYKILIIHKYDNDVKHLNNDTSKVPYLNYILYDKKSKTSFSISHGPDVNYEIKNVEDVYTISLLNEYLLPIKEISFFRKRMRNYICYSYKNNLLENFIMYSNKNFYLELSEKHTLNDIIDFMKNIEKSSNDYAIHKFPESYRYKHYPKW